MAVSTSKYNKLIWYIIGISFIARFFFAYFLEFGNDEVYYWLLSSYPALSYFDHPPMLFTIINLLSFGHYIDAEWAMRLPSLISVSITTWLIYDLGRSIKSARAGFIAAILAQCSFYIFIISGFFIIPDGVLSVFWLLALRSAFKFFDEKNNEKNKQLHLLLFGLFIGLGAITKYHILALWLSFGLIVLYKTISQPTYFKRIISNYRVYLSILITIIAFTPVIVWNISNDFASFKFHESRLSFFGSFNPLYFFREIFGQFVYNNFVVFILAFIGVFRWQKKRFISKSNYTFILWFSLPLIGIFLFFSLFRATFPHWSAPGYYLLIILAGAYLDDMKKQKFPKIIHITVAFTSILYITAFAVIQNGLFISNPNSPNKNKIENDVTLDMYGWGQLSKQLIKNSDSYPTSTKMIVANKWYNAAHLDYYLCRNSDFELMAIGSIADTHEYERINKERGFTDPPNEAIFIQPQRAGRNPIELYSNIYNEINCIDTLEIYRNKVIAQKVYVFLLKK